MEIAVFLGDLYCPQNRIERPQKGTTKAIFYPLFLKFSLRFISLAATIINIMELTRGTTKKGNKWNVTEDAHILSFGQEPVGTQNGQTEAI